MKQQIDTLIKSMNSRIHKLIVMKKGEIMGQVCSVRVI